jgi:tetratricopeptide (TPR) repeat protein
MMVSKRTSGVCLRLIACLVAVVLASGCSASRKSAFEDDKGATQSKVKGDFLTALEQAESHWQERKDQKELEKAISLWEKAIQMEAPGLSDEEKTDKQAEAYERLARSYYFLADSHIRLQGDDEEANEEEMMRTYEKGVTAAENAIKLRDPNFSAKLAQGESWQDHVKQADEAAIPGLYWYATNLGKWALLEGIATILARKDDIKATMEFICDKNEKFYYGACHRYFAVYWTKVPFSKDAEKAKKHFDKTLEIAPDYFATKVLMAENYAVLADKRKLYDKLVAEVIETPVDAVPEITPENFYEKEKARRLQKTASDRFR